jgi:hypothetical protein
MKIYEKISLIFLLALLVNVTGCTGVQSFSTAARSGDTISLMVGYYPEISRGDITVSVYDSSYVLLETIPAGDPRIRAFVQTYPDPLSKAVVGYETNQDIDGSEASWGYLISTATGYESEWLQSMLIMDLPTGLPLGTANVLLSVPAYPELSTKFTSVEILNGSGSSNLFSASGSGDISDQQIQSLERANHYNISFTGATIPHAIEINMTHNADVDNGGVGRAYVVNPRGDIKNINWSDDGINLKVILIPTHDKPLSDMQNFKFYVAGEITGLTLVDAQGFDANGNLITITTSVTP